MPRPHSDPRADARAKTTRRPLPAIPAGSGTDFFAAEVEHNATTPTTLTSTADSTVTQRVPHSYTSLLPGLNCATFAPSASCRTAARSSVCPSPRRRTYRLPARIPAFSLTPSRNPYVPREIGPPQLNHLLGTRLDVPSQTSVTDGQATLSLCACSRGRKKDLHAAYEYHCAFV